MTRALRIAAPHLAGLAIGLAATLTDRPFAVACGIAVVAIVPTVVRCFAVGLRR